MSGGSEQVGFNAPSLAVGNAFAGVSQPASPGRDYEIPAQGLMSPSSVSIPATAKRWSPAATRNTDRGVAEKSVVTQAHGGRRVVDGGASEDSGPGSRSKRDVSQPSKAQSAGPLTTERKRLVHKKRRSWPSSAEISRPRKRAGRSTRKSRTRIVRLVTSMLLLVFIVNYCTRGQRSNQGRSVLTRSSATRSSMKLLRKDRAPVTEVLSSRRLADADLPHSPFWQQDTTEACSSTLRALASNVLRETDEEDFQNPLPQGKNQRAAVLDRHLRAHSILRSSRGPSQQPWHEGRARIFPSLHPIPCPFNCTEVQQA